ncbi:hypothetical protein WJX84_008575 [Apatococcus fuscideae]|uniref:Oxysterol-binding protein n=1 Tax=Apatococcus fuscideae TaxID=2026836 RepID=A0AAW1SKK1_9CHLO
MEPGRLSGPAQQTNLSPSPQSRKLSPLPDPEQITVGVLTKYVNFGKGCVPPFSFFDRGSSDTTRQHIWPTKVNVELLLETLRKEGEVIMIGAQTNLLDTKGQLLGQTNLLDTKRSHTFPGVTPKQTPQAEMHLQVCTIAPSESDNRKLYINSGSDLVLRLRAESKEDCSAWLDFLQRAKGSWADLSPVMSAAVNSSGQNNSAARIASVDNSFLELLESVKRRLMDRQASPDVLALVEDVLLRQHQQYHDVMAAEAVKRQTLLQHIKSLENVKRELETQMVVDSYVANGPALSSKTSGASEPSEASASDAELDVDARVARPSVNADDSDEEEVFYDCDSSAAAAAAGPSGRAAEALQARESSDSVTMGASPPSGTPPWQQSHEAAPPGKHSMGQAESNHVARNSGGGAQSATGQQIGSLPPAPIRTSDGRLELPTPAWLAHAEQPEHRRVSLPKPAQAEKSVSLWSIIKDVVGKDLTRVCLPVYFNEPLSALQRTAEDLEYSELCDQASLLPKGSWERLIRVATFAVSGYSASAPHRTSKPFNPLLGETYEFICPEKGFRFIGEKVVHHPTIMAAYCEGRTWIFEGDGELRSKFWGRSIELQPVGVCKLTFHDGESFTWQKITTSINNLILGRLYVDHGGIMRIKSTEAGLVAKVRFKEAGMMSKDVHQIRGHVEQNGTKVEKLELHGTWDGQISVDLPDGSHQQLWQKAPLPADPTRYQLTSWAIKLNEITPGLRENLAPTDCRLRPDQHATEVGQYDEANSEKLRLEQKQRAARKAADRGDPIKPLWFDVRPEVQMGEDVKFPYHGGYFEARQVHDFSNCRDIFGPGGGP